MTYNVNYGLAGDHQTLDAIADSDVDLVVLQETNEAWEAAIRQRLSARYPHMEFRHAGLAGGLAVLSRHPLEAKEYLEPVGEGWFPAWRVILHGPLGPTQILAVHLRPPLSDQGSVVSGYFATPSIRKGEMEAFVEVLDPALPTIVAGDFNESSSGSAIAVLNRKGYRSALPEFGGRQSTWRWQTSVGTVSSQLDHLVIDRKLELLDVRVVNAGRSDHLPVIGVFQRADDAPAER
jgi:endonuclease/exonuclease/phosphatase (EEP) superfamily protein YafD